MSECGETIARLREHGYSVVADGASVIVIETNGPYGLMERPSRATRYESLEIAVKKLIDDEEFETK